MSRWFRFYDDAINDPKILKLSDKAHRVWIGMLCLASKNEGKLPPFDDMVILLRMKPEKLQAELEVLIAAGLLDHDDAGIEPHNWNGRQYKTDGADPTNATRQKRYRDRHRNAVTTVTDKRPETEQIQNRTEAEPRDDLKKRTGSFQQAIVKAFEDANYPNLPETSRAGLWLSQGYQEDICLAVIADIVKKKPSITTLNYFDKPIADAHSSKAPPRQAVAQKTEDTDWNAVLSTFKKTGRWSRWAGPDLDSPGCLAPPEMLANYGLVKDTGPPIVAPQIRSMQ